jgi:uncharacterized repeat protein (TIGR04076 family)
MHIRREIMRMHARIVEQKGYCAAGHRVGDEIDLNGIRCPDLCGGFYHSIYPIVMAMKYGAELPWLEDKDRISLVCPDYVNPVKLEIVRTEE